MRELVQVLVYGLTIGSVYALVALGYSLIFSTTGIVNFAQGTLVVVRRLPRLVVLRRAPSTTASRSWSCSCSSSCCRPDRRRRRPGGRGCRSAGSTRDEHRAGSSPPSAPASSSRSSSRSLISDEGQPVPALVGVVLRLARLGGRGRRDPARATPCWSCLTVLVSSRSKPSSCARRIGLAFRAVAQDRQAASLMGINPTAMVMLTLHDRRRPRRARRRARGAPPRESASTSA